VLLLTIDEVLEIHSRILEQSGGAQGVRDLGALESAVAQPHQTFEGRELAALEVTLVMNGFELAANVDEQEQVMLALAAGQLSREEFTTWVNQHLKRVAF